jgi:soluble lytic murein transglycosylase-like protein
MPFAKVRIVVPDILKVYSTFSQPATKNANIEMIRRINSDYGGYINKFASAFEMPAGLIVAFIATESNGNKNAISSCCPEIRGLMQVSPAAVYDTATKWSSVTSVPMPSAAVQELNSKVPEILQNKSLASIKNKIISYETDPSFNIMAGCMTLRWCIEKYSTFLTGAQINKAMIAYNYGVNRKALRDYGKVVVDTTAMYNNDAFPRESKSYLVKMLGVDGFLSLIFKDKVI